MAAVLLGLPSIIRSEPYGIINPHAHIGYITHVQRQEDADKILDSLIAEANQQQDASSTTDHGRESDFIVDDGEQDEDEQQVVRTKLHDPKAILYELGFIDKFSWKEDDDDTTTYRHLFPQCSLYGNRGQHLKHISRIEYASLVTFSKPSKSESRRSDEFAFGDGFLLNGLAVQKIMAKQRTPLVIRKPPRHPGKRPSTRSKRYESWLENANRYAEFFLVLFRPEPDCYEKKHVNTYEYTWDALESFVNDLEQDNSIISKFRLMAMHTRMKGFVTSFRSKLILTKYRSRDADKWNRRQLQDWETRDAWERKEGEVNKIIDQYLFKVQHNDLGVQKTNRLHRKLAHSTKVTDAFAETFNAHKASYSNSYKPFPTRNMQRPCTFADTPPDIQDMGTRIRRFDKEGLPPTAAYKKPYSYHLLPNTTRRRKHRESLKDFKPRQRELYELYKNYLKNPNKATSAPPPIVMLHGGAGTGKSTLLKAILDYAHFKKIDTVRSAFNSINALHIRGETTWLLLYMDGSDKNNFQGMGNNDIPKFRTTIEKTKLIVVDELSNQAPWHLAKLDKSCQQARNSDLPFGGIPVILCGDLMQLEPVRAGLSFPAAVIEMCENVWCKPSSKHLRYMRAKENKKKKTEQDEDPDLKPKRFDKQHPFHRGASIIRNARLFQLEEQVRSDDPQHAKFVTKLFRCKRPRMEELRAIPLLTENDFSDPTSPWFKAPILVLTHRERHSLTHYAAIRYAKATGRPVICWKSHTENWKQAPPEHLKHKAYNTRAFTSTGWKAWTPSSTTPSANSSASSMRNLLPATA